MSSRRWLVITSSFPRHEGDVAGHFVERWCRALVDRGHEIDVLCWRGGGIENRDLGPGLRVRFVPYAWRDAESLFFGAGAPENLSEVPTRALLAVPAVAAMVTAALQACAHSDYDGVVGHWLVPGGGIARIVGAATGLSARVVGHSAGVHLLRRLPSPVGRRLASWICGAPVTVPTSVLREYLVRIAGGADIRVAPMGYETAPESVCASSHCAGQGLQLGFVGRLVPIKGLGRVIEAIKRLRTQGLDIRLDVLGDGPSREQWEGQSGEGVRFLGATFGDKKWEKMASWDAFVMPSKINADGRHEGLPVSLLEASSVGAVPLVSGVPGVDHWLANPRRQRLQGGVEQWCEALGWVDGLRPKQMANLRRETRHKVQQLAWREYAPWWEDWMGS